MQEDNGLRDLWIKAGLHIKSRISQIKSSFDADVPMEEVNGKIFLMKHNLLLKARTLLNVRVRDYSALADAFKEQLTNDLTGAELAANLEELPMIYGL